MCIESVCGMFVNTGICVSTFAARLTLPQYKMAGNSLSVHIVSRLMELLLLCPQWPAQEPTALMGALDSKGAPLGNECNAEK
jgi:hypothetical protein